MLLRHLARPMLASWFVYEGVQTARKPSEHVRAARSGVELVDGRAGVEVPPLDDAQLTRLVRAHGVATAVAGLCLGLGKSPRSAALALAALSAPLAVVNQPFTAPRADRSERTRKFVANLGAIGAALIAGADYEGRPGVRWRLDRARHDLALAAEAKQVAALSSAKHLGTSASRAARTATEAVHGAGSTVRAKVA